MKYKEALKKDPIGWKKAVKEEYERMESHGVFKPIPKNELPPGTKVLTSTWAMKQKANGTKRARVNARGYEQKEGVHYHKDGVSSPVVNEASIFIILTLIVMARMHTDMNDVKGAFLNGVFSKQEELYMEVPEGFHEYYGWEVVLLLLKTIYGLKQAAYEYWIALLKAIRQVGMARSKADPCVYFRWTKNGLNMWSSWVDDLLSCAVEDEDLTQGREAIKTHFSLDEVGPLEEYVGCKIEYNKDEGDIKLTQPVLIQSLEDEFDLSEVKPTMIPAAAGSMLMKSEEKMVDEATHYTYRKGTGKLIHLTKYSRPETYNAVRELSRQGSNPVPAHLKAMYKVMKYCLTTRERGLILKPNAKWDGKDKSFKFVIHGESDSDYAKCPITRRSVSGWGAFLCGAPYARKSKMQPTVAQSVTEAETNAAASCANDMVYGKDFIESLGLQVELPMILYVDNKGAVDLLNSWSVSGATRHIAVKLNYIRELKEQGIISIKWKAGEDNSADLFTKNLDRKTFEKHAAKYIDLAGDMYDQVRDNEEDEAATTEGTIEVTTVMCDSGGVSEVGIGESHRTGVSLQDRETRLETAQSEQVHSERTHSERAVAGKVTSQD
jgi:hypothetical protein